MPRGGRARLAGGRRARGGLEGEGWPGGAPGGEALQPGEGLAGGLGLRRAGGAGLGQLGQREAGGEAGEQGGDAGADGAQGFADEFEPRGRHPLWKAAAVELIRQVLADQLDDRGEALREA